LVKHPLGRYLERAIARELKMLAWQIVDHHPGSLQPEAIDRANHILEFDQELVIGPLGFPSVEAYYQASSPLYILPQLRYPTLMIYAADDPLFLPELADELQQICGQNPYLKLMLTPQGGHVSHFSSRRGQRQAADPDQWWAWNRILDWCRPAVG
jgi:predicted alpha/beta-fold hydrolase